ncbi:hypothetical protein HYW32_01990 [Candidatus Berkelbacteria bacterium]|nr:hypothetical protein [Candidatus Berkelbacteria bacterium]
MKKWMFWIGILIVGVTHLYILFAGLPTSQMITHAIFNLIATALIVFSRE